MGLTKEQVASKCKTAGLNVKIEDGVVKLIFDVEKKDEQVEAFLRKLEELGYHSSFGYRGKSNSDKNIFSETATKEISEKGNMDYEEEI